MCGGVCYVTVHLPSLPYLLTRGWGGGWWCVYCALCQWGNDWAAVGDKDLPNEPWGGKDVSGCSTRPPMQPQRGIKWLSTMKMDVYWCVSFSSHNLRALSSQMVDCMFLWEWASARACSWWYQCGTRRSASTSRSSMSRCVCVCVCERERERKSACEMFITVCTCIQEQLVNTHTRHTSSYFHSFTPHLSDLLIFPHCPFYILYTYCRIRGFP